MSNKMPTETAVVAVTYPRKGKFKKRNAPRKVPIVNAIFTLQDGKKIVTQDKFGNLIASKEVNILFKFAAAGGFKPVRLTFYQRSGGQDFDGENNMPSIDHVANKWSLLITNYFFDSSTIPGDVRWKMIFWLLDRNGKLVRIDPEIENREDVRKK